MPILSSSECGYVGARVLVCSARGVLRRGPPPTFIGSRGAGVHAWKVSDCVIFSPNRGRTMGSCCCRALWGMASGVVVILISLLAMRRMRRRPVAPVGGVETFVERAVLRVCPWWSAEDPADGSLALVKGRTVSEGCSHARRGSCRRGSARSWQHSGGSSVRHVRTARRRSAQCPEWWHSGRS
jgi:hypothetical protein